MNIEYFITVGSLAAVCWLINQMAERKFCRKASKEVKDYYIEVLKAKNKK